MCIHNTIEYRQTSSLSLADILDTYDPFNPSACRRSDKDGRYSFAKVIAAEYSKVDDREERIAHDLEVSFYGV